MFQLAGGMAAAVQRAHVGPGRGEAAHGLRCHEQVIERALTAPKFVLSVCLASSRACRYSGAVVAYTVVVVLVVAAPVFTATRPQQHGTWSRVPSVHHLLTTKSFLSVELACRREQPV